MDIAHRAPTRLKRRLGLLAVAAAAAISALPAAALGSTAQEAIFQDDSQLTGISTQNQRATLDEMKALGADTIHAIVYWGQYAPRPASARRPGGDPSSPSYYSLARIGILDSLVRETRARDMSLILSPAGAAVGSTRIRVPRWARSGRSPRISEFRKFVSALGRRYSGTFRAGGAIIPRVSRWGMWNEPNIGGWIQPQYNRVRGRTVPYGPVLYRQLYNAGRGALLSTGHSSDQIYLGEFAPLGRNRQSATAPIAPGKFLREMACLDGSYRPIRGASASRRRCGGFSGLRTSAIAHHIYTEGRGQPPTFRGAPDVFPVGNLAGLESVVDRIAARGRINRGLRFLNTEFGFQSNPPDRRSGVSLNQQAQFENESEYLEYRRPRWTGFTHYLMVDDRCTGPRCGGFQTGLRFRGGTRKIAYHAYRLPIVARSSGGGARVWGANRPGGAGSQIEILVNGTAVQTVDIVNANGYFDVPVAGSSRAIYQLRDPATGAKSRPARVSPGIA